MESKKGYIEIEVEFDELQPATKLGSEYLTYVLWAVTPEGRTSNLGEILLNGAKGKLNVTTEMQVFALLVTAEPYYAVTRPSDLIVMENVVRADTKGKVEEIDAKYELLQRGQYQRLANPLALKLDKKVPLELYEARNAVQIARAIGADRFATETFGKAEKSLSEAEAYQARNAGNKPVAMTARKSVQMAEDARAIAVKRQEEQALAAERQSSFDRETRSESERAAAQAETARIAREAETAGIQAKAETERLAREMDAQRTAARADAERLKRENEVSLEAARSETERAAAEANAAKIQAQADIDRLQQEKDSQSLAAQTEAARLKLENEGRVATAQSEADRLRLENDAKMATAGAEAERLKRENDAQRASAQVSWIALSETRLYCGPSCCSNSISSCRPATRSRPDREHVGRSVRHGQIHLAACRSGETRQGCRHCGRPSGTSARRRRLHRQRRWRRLQSAPFRTTRKRGARLSDKRGNGGNFGHGQGFRQGQTGCYQ